VERVFPLPPLLVSAQIDAVLREISVDAVKTGMLWSEGIVMAVRQSILRHALRRVVIDPVIASHGGARLLTARAREAMLRYLFPLADLITPNASEAGQLAGVRIRHERDILEAAKRLMERGPRAVLIKGGHIAAGATDWYYDGRLLQSFKAAWRRGPKLHGSGCILSAAIAAGLARGLPIEDAVRTAKNYVGREMRRAWPAGRETGLALHC
jgi:hydroxymethylpyrimidine/phosphomethylpyrimidine kinase